MVLRNDRLKTSLAVGCLFLSLPFTIVSVAVLFAFGVEMDRVLFFAIALEAGLSLMFIALTSVRLRDLDKKLAPLEARYMEYNGGHSRSQNQSAVACRTGFVSSAGRPSKSGAFDRQGGSSMGFMGRETGA